VLKGGMNVKCSLISKKLAIVTNSRPARILKRFTKTVLRCTPKLLLKLACALATEQLMETISTGKDVGKVTVLTPGGHFSNTAGAAAAPKVRAKEFAENGNPNPTGFSQHEREPNIIVDMPQETEM